MRPSTCKTLPLETLYDLLIDGIKKLISAFDSKEDRLIVPNAQKKYVEGLIALIEEKKKETAKNN